MARQQLATRHTRRAREDVVRTRLLHDARERLRSRQNRPRPVARLQIVANVHENTDTTMATVPPSTTYTPVALQEIQNESRWLHGDWASASEESLVMALHQAVSELEEELFANELVRAAGCLSAETLRVLAMESIQKNCRIVLRKLMSSGCVDLVPCVIPAVALAAEKSRFSAMSLLIRDCGVRRALGKPYRAPMIAQQAFELFSKQARRVAQICFQDGACLREQYASASDDALARIIAMAYGSTLITSGVSGEHLMDRSTALMLDFLGHVRGTKLTAVTALRTARY